MKRYRQSAKGKAVKRRYQISAKGRAAQKSYDLSPKGKARRRLRTKRSKMLKFFRNRRFRDVGVRRDGYTGDVIDKAIDDRMRSADERVYEELREVSDAGR